ncbi:hypothetical protein [Paracoccus sp. MKU1]|uniref:hypothetical protein n=1 Tax=Paracoccus sp. MKU1 TaxID=1745182 RepID=UPI0007193E64|nr:hypothetical protein [Paracoccus sp. MKU1]KRW94290.1 hypothetical protein AQY21_20385 [Paracoccus sp. MKU1]
MTNRYEDAAREVEAEIARLEDRAARWEKHPTLFSRVPGIREEIAVLKAKPLANWRATGKWANEIWGTAVPKTHS